MSVLYNEEMAKVGFWTCCFSISTGKWVVINWFGKQWQSSFLTPHVFSGVSEEDFVTYKGTYGDALSGKLDTEAGVVNLSLEGRGSTKLQSCFGKLKKEELDFNKLLRDSKDRYE